MNGRLVYCRKAFSEDSAERMVKKVLEQCLFSQKKLDILNVEDLYAKQFICNSVEIDNNIITPSIDGYDLFGDQHSVSCCDMSEFMKAGGAVRCLTLEL